MNLLGWRRWVMNEINTFRNVSLKSVNRDLDEFLFLAGNLVQWAVDSDSTGRLKKKKNKVSK